MGIIVFVLGVVTIFVLHTTYKCYMNSKKE